MSASPLRRCRLALWLLACTVGVCAQASDILIVRSSELAPYQKTEAAFVRAVGLPTRTLTTAQLKEGGRALREALDKAPLVLALGPDAAAAVTAAAPRAPVLHALVPNAGRIDGLEHSTGIPLHIPEDRGIALVQSLVPAAKKVGVLFDPAQSEQRVEALGRASAAAGLTLVPLRVSSRGEVVSSVQSLLPQVDVLLLIPDTTIISVETFRYMLVRTLDARIPLVGFSEAMVKAGALGGLVAEYEEMGTLAAETARRLLAKQPLPDSVLRGKLYLNAKTAAALGVTFTPPVEASATTVFR